jgi:hypothetical protein
LHSIIINTPGAAGGTITIYDSPTASGEIVATITVVSSQWTATALYDVQLNYGLTVVVAGMTTPDLTITWVYEIGERHAGKFWSGF